MDKVKVHFAIPMRQIKREIEVDSGTMIKDVFASEGQAVADMADVAFNGKGIEELADGYNTAITEECHLWGLIQSEGGI